MIHVLLSNTYASSSSHHFGFGMTTKIYNIIEHSTKKEHFGFGQFVATA
jgi:hypothetical protein